MGLRNPVKPYLDDLVSFIKYQQKPMIFTMFQHSPENETDH